MMNRWKQSVRARFVVTALILATMVIYMPPFIRSFVGDDYLQFDYIKPFVHNPTTIWQLFNPTAVSWYYRPTQNLWFWLNRLLLGWEPTGYYIILLWFHALAIALLYRLARQFRLGLFAALCTTLLFAIHSHWVDVVSWISSVAIIMGAIFSLLTVSAMMAYGQRPSTRQLLLVFTLTLLTFLSHEEAVLLPPFLLLLLLVGRSGKSSAIFRAVLPLRGGPRRMIYKREIVFFSLLALITAAYLIVQFSRPNPTVQVSTRSPAQWLAFLEWTEMVTFVVNTAYRFTFAPQLLALSGFAANLLVVGLAILFIVWFWQGNRVVRLWLVWALAHLFFIYWALWSQLPTLYAGRHIYQAGAGMALAIGATIQQVSKGASWRFKLGKRAFHLRALDFQRIILLIVMALSLYHIREARIAQQLWLENVTEEEVAKAQLFELFPNITEQNHVFAYRFPIAPAFTRAVLQLWYDVPLSRPGGGLAHLAAHGRATPNFIVLDYENGQVYNLMPELQESDQTSFLWTDQTNEMIAVAGANGSRLALSQTPVAGEWTGARYRLNVPAGAVLRTAVLAQPGLDYRLRLESETAFTQPALPAGSPARWVEVSIPLSAFAGEEMTISLQAMAETEPVPPAYWANPRLVR